MRGMRCSKVLGRGRIAWSLWMVLLQAAASPASAQEQDVPEARSTVGEPRSQALETGHGHDLGYVLTLSAAYLAAPAVGGMLAAASPPLGLALYFTLAPAVHLAHGNLLWAGLSIVGPTASAAAGWYGLYVLQAPCSSSLQSPFRCLQLPAIGALIGYTAWATLDVICNVKRPRARPRGAPAVSAAPLERGFAVAVHGAF